jgi:hypothetical protein
MPDYRVNLETGVPPRGFVVVRAASSEDAHHIVHGLIHDVELTGSDDRILFDHVGDIAILDIIEVEADTLGEPINDEV